MSRLLDPDRDTELGKRRLRLRDDNCFEAGGGESFQRVGDQRSAAQQNAGLGPTQTPGQSTRQNDSEDRRVPRACLLRLTC